MKSLIVLLFALIIFSSIAFVNPRSSFATTNNNINSNYTQFMENWFAKWREIIRKYEDRFNEARNFCKNHPQDNKCKKDDDNDCKKHPERRGCHCDVPEFGSIPGAIALLSSGGAFLFLKKRTTKN